MDVFETACRRAVAYRASVAHRPVRPDRDYHQMRALFAGPLPEGGRADTAVIEELADLGEPGLMQITHPKFFGWVMGGSGAVGVAADWLVSAWGQNAAMHLSSPTAAAVEETAAGWLLELFDLPREAAVGFVTGATMGSFTALAAARSCLLARQGWDCEENGLFGAPPVHVLVGEDVHVSVLCALRYLGFGSGRIVRVATDAQGRMRPGDLVRCSAACQGAMLIVGQAGQINTGAFDPFTDLADIAQARDAWLHVDGAFGLWARAHPDLYGLAEGVERADSWVVDGHKWLQVPFDAGYAIVRDADALRRAMTTAASYLPEAGRGDRVPSQLVPELSRRARGLPTWAALRHLGRSGVADLVSRNCEMARRMAQDLGAVPGIRVMNDVVLNQIVLRFGREEDGPEHRAVLAKSVIDLLTENGEVYVAGSAWRGEWVMRISVTCGATRMQDASEAAAAIISAWTQVSASSTGATEMP